MNVCVSSLLQLNHSCTQLLCHRNFNYIKYKNYKCLKVSFLMLNISAQHYQTYLIIKRFYTETDKLVSPLLSCVPDEG